jgi:hypothetical protein
MPWTKEHPKRTTGKRRDIIDSERMNGNDDNAGTQRLSINAGKVLLTGRLAIER